MVTPKIWLRELRAEFLTASVVPVLLATAVARYETGMFDPYLFALTLAGAVFLHLGTNIANDYFDHYSGADPLNVQYERPVTGGSRLIQEGLISARTVLATSVSFYIAAAVVAVFIVAQRGALVVLFGAIGLASGFFYTAPPIRFAHRGLGELVVGLNFGLLITMAAYYVQTGRFSGGSIVASLPLSCLIAAVIIINEFQDSDADARAGKRTLVVRLGTARSVALFAAVTLSAYVPIVAGVSARLLPPLTLAACVTLPLTLKAITTARSRHDSPERLTPANASTILSHLLTGLIMFAAYIIAG